MEKRDQTTPDEKVRTARGAAPHRHPPASPDDTRGQEAEGPPPFEWQAVLLRYLPNPHGAHHCMKRFSAR